jgi:transcriptional regulator with XRE-family HTH domain
MTSIVDSQIATVLRREREHRGWSIGALSERSGVSKAMISKIERREVSPTAALLGRLSGALSLTLTELLAHAEASSERLVRQTDQPVWTDPETGYSRRALSPAAPGGLELIEASLPPGRSVSFPADAYAFVHQQIWVLEGSLRFREGDVDHDLTTGDCLQLGPPAHCTFANRSRVPCRYLVAIARR